MKEISLSIIVPVFNMEKYLLQCLNSIAAQEIKNFEIIIVDDGSTDSSLDMCHNFSNINANVKVYSKKNEGQGVARNYGLARAQGKYIAYVDSDDYLMPTMACDVVKVLEETNADFANFGASFVDTNHKIIKSVCPSNFKLLIGDEIFHNALIDNGIYTISVNKIYRRSFLLDNKIEFPALKSNEDIFFSRAVAYYAKKTVFIPSIYYIALIRKGSTSRSMDKSIFTNSIEIIKYERNHFSPKISKGITADYFDAHILKFFTYILIQAAFRINNISEYKECFLIAQNVAYSKIAKNKRATSLLSVKSRAMITLCQHKYILRFIANILNIFRLSSFVY
jgi:glycosyltransferase involved in cell wall biosynthesis